MLSGELISSSLESNAVAMWNLRLSRGCSSDDPKPREYLHSLHQLNLTHTPGLVEPGLEGTVEAEKHVPSFTGNGLHPVRLGDSVWELRPKPDICRTIRVSLKAFVETVDAGEALVGLQIRASL